MEAPKTFISYSWSTPEHQNWVLKMATQLRDSGVDVILDVWDLKVGQSPIAFMERMVTDPEVGKVIVISDKTYATKADGFKGGVGTESQIISKNVYENQEQTKFVAVVVEYDDKGNPCLPTYLKSRLYIDFSSSENFTDNFEQLLRWLYDKPRHRKPKLGSPPSFLQEKDAISLGTTTEYHRAINAVKEHKKTASGALEDYLSTFSKNLEEFRIKEFEGFYDDALVASIESFLPYRNEFCRLLNVVSRYAPNEENIEKIHSFFEKLIPYTKRPHNISRWHSRDFDNFKFIIHELFLYTTAILIKSENFKQLDMFLSKLFYVGQIEDFHNLQTIDYTVFRNHIPSLSERNDRLKLNWITLHGQLLKERCQGSEIEFRHILQADFVLYLRLALAGKLYSDAWYPITSCYLEFSYNAMELFGRANSKQYFEKMVCVLGISSKNELEAFMTQYTQSGHQLDRVNISNTIGFNQLATAS